MWIMLLILIIGCIIMEWPMKPPKKRKDDKKK